MYLLRTVIEKINLVSLARAVCVINGYIYIFNMYFVKVN